MVRVGHGRGRTAASRPFAYDDGFTRWRSVLSEGRELHGLTRDFPQHERPHLESEGVLSQIVVPVSVGDEWWGFIGFDDYATERVWPAAEVEALKAAADTLGAAIGRTRAEHQRREEQVARQELELRTSAVLASALEAIVTMDERGRIVDFNPAAERMFGYALQDVAGESLAEILIPPELRERHRAGFTRFLETGEPAILGKHLEVEALRADGRRLPIELTVTQVQMPGTTLFTGFIRDLTERRNAELQLREAEQRYRTLVENLPAATYIDLVDDGSTTLYISPQIEAIWGYTQQEWTADPDIWINALHPDDRERTLAAVERHNELGEPFEVEYRFRAKDGRWTWVGDHATAVRDEAGRIAFSQGAMFDVTERRQAEDQLREAEERYRAIVEHVPAAIYVDVPDGSMQSRLRQPPDRADHGLHARGVHRRPRALARPDRGRAAAGGDARDLRRRDPRTPPLVDGRVPDPPQGRARGVGARRDHVRDRRARGAAVPAGRDVRRDRTQAGRTRPARERAARTRGRRTPAGDRRDEEHLPRGGVARAPEPAHLDPRALAHARAAGADRPRSSRSCSAGWR